MPKTVNGLVKRNLDIEHLGNTKIVFVMKDYGTGNHYLCRLDADIYEDLTAEIDTPDGRIGRVVGTYLDDAEFGEWRLAIEQFGHAVRENPDKRIEDVFEEMFKGMVEA